MNAQVDLRQLAVRRDGPAAVGPNRPRHIISRYVLPAVVLLGFLAVGLWAMRDSLLPSKPVTVVPVFATRAEVQQGGTPLFQSAGWIEPRPTPVLVTALAEGVIDKLLVVEGQEVKAGEPVATLIDIDARLAARIAEAEVHLVEADLASAQASLAAAKTNLTFPVQLQAGVAESEAMLAKLETELAVLPFQLRSAQAKQRLARATLESKSRAADTGAVPELQYRQAESDLESAAAAVEELKAREPRLKHEIAALSRKRDALRKQLELKSEETRQLAEAEAKIKVVEARVHHAKVGLDAAQLKVDRMVVQAPSSGRILSLVARPGMRLMGLAQGTLQESSTVVTLYDPALLQVRADVRFEDLPRVQPGQPVRIESPAVPAGGLEGEVLFPTSLADIQKNTLQVKVAIKNPPAVLKPDMLVQVTFLAPESPASKTAGLEQLRLMIPRRLIDTQDGGTRVWLADQVGRVAVRRAVKIGQSMRGELVEVTEGLNAGDKLISGGREGLGEGQRIQIIGEDSALGTEAQLPGAKPNRLQRLTGDEGKSKSE